MLSRRVGNFSLFRGSESNEFLGHGDRHAQLRFVGAFLVPAPLLRFSCSPFRGISLVVGFFLFDSRIFPSFEASTQISCDCAICGLGNTALARE